MTTNNIAVFDIDNTVVSGHTQKMFVKYLFRNRVVGMYFIFKVLFWFALYKLGIVKDVKSMVEKSFKLFCGYQKEYVDNLIDDCFEKDVKPNIYKGAIEEINNCKESGFKIILISNTLQGFVDKFIKLFNADFGVGTKLDESKGFLTGNIVGELVYGVEKKKVLQRLINSKFLNPNIIKCYADHYSDIEILNFSTIPVVVNPDIKLENFAKNKKWEIKNFKL